MKSLVAAVCLLGMLSLKAIEPTSLRHYANVPPDVKLHFSNFCLGRYEPLLADDEKGFTLLATTPGLTPALLELANHLEIEQEWDGYTHAWGLLSRRMDATEIEQRLVRDKLDGLLNRNADPGGTSFKQWGLTFLGNYPSEENESLLIRYLTDTNGGALHGDSTDDATASLGRIGTAASIEPLRAYAEKRKPAPGNKSRYYETAIAALNQIKARVENASPRGTNEAVTPSQARPPKKGEPSKVTAIAYEPEGKSWLVWLLVVIAATATALWLFLRKSK